MKVFLIMLCITIKNFFSVNMVIDKMIEILQLPLVSLVKRCT